MPSLQWRSRPARRRRSREWRESRTRKGRSGRAPAPTRLRGRALVVPFNGGIRPPPTDFRQDVPRFARLDDSAVFVEYANLLNNRPSQGNDHQRRWRVVQLEVDLAEAGDSQVRRRESHTEGLKSKVTSGRRISRRQEGGYRGGGESSQVDVLRGARQSGALSNQSAAVPRPEQSAREIPRHTRVAKRECWKAGSRS